MTPTSITLSSVGTSPPIMLDYWAGRPTFAAVYGSSGGFTGAVSLQVSADDPKVDPTTWITDPNMTALTSAAFTTYLGPIAQLRLSSSALTSGSFVLKAVQSIGQ
jgi:hypothetical protein